MPDRIVSSRLSGDVIDLLLRRGMTMGDIARAIGATTSFVSRVKARSRSLTIDHLGALEAHPRQPLPLLLLEATPIHSVPRELKPLYRSTARVLRSGRRKTRATTTRTRAA